MYTICVSMCFGSRLVKNKKEKIDPHKLMLINDVAMVTHVFNKLLHLLFNMNTLVYLCPAAIVLACWKILILVIQVRLP